MKRRKRGKRKRVNGTKRIHCDNCNKFVLVPDVPGFESICVECKYIRIPRYGSMNKERSDRRFV